MEISEIPNGMSPEVRSKRIKIIFAILFLSNFISNFDHGILPAINTVMKEEFNLDNI